MAILKDHQIVIYFCKLYFLRKSIYLIADSHFSAHKASLFTSQINTTHTVLNHFDLFYTLDVKISVS